MSTTKTTSLEKGFYVIGGTLRYDALCYVKRQADRDLYNSLRQGRFCYVLTPRQMGKSSLMVRIATQLREAGTGVAVLDLTAIGQNITAEQWYRGMLSEMGQQLQLESELLAFWRGRLELGPLQRWMRALREVVLPRYPGPVVVFVDEIDAVRSLPFSTDEFFAAIREFYNRRTQDEELARLSFCLLGVATPSDLIRDTRTTPFNIGQRIELHDFTEEEAASLTAGLKREERLGATLLKRILHWTGGHPYLTQRLCQAVAEDGGVNTAAEVDRLCVALFFSPRAQERDDNLLFVRERMLRSDVDLASLLSLYAQVGRHKRVRDDETNPLVSILRLSGITRVDDGCLRERNGTYAHVFGRAWIKANMPDAEVRRQRAALRRGLLRATGVAAVIVAMMAALIWLAVLQRNRALEQQEANSRLFVANRRLLYAARMNLAQQAWEAGDSSRMKELLVGQEPKPDQEDLRGFEWYYLRRLSHSRLSVSHKNLVNSVAFSPDGKILATGSDDKTLRLWEAATGRELATLAGHNDRAVQCVVFSQDGKSLVSSGNDRTAKLWDLASRKELVTFKGHTHVVWSVAISPDGKKLATGSFDNTVKLWETATGKELMTLKGHVLTDWGVTFVRFSPDGQILASKRGETVKLWEAATGRELAAYEGRGGGMKAVAFSPDGRSIATTSEDNNVEVFELGTRRRPQTFRGHTGAITSVAFSPDGKRLASGSFDRTVRLWYLTGQEVSINKGHAATVRDVVFSPDSKRLASASDDWTAILWETASKEDPTTLKGHGHEVTSLAFSPDGTVLASGSYDRSAKLWDVTSGHELMTLKGHEDFVESVAVSSDGKTLATGSRDGTAKTWSMADGRELITLRPNEMVKSVVFSPDSKMLATGSVDGSLKLWDANNGKELVFLDGRPNIIPRLAFSPDGTKLASGSYAKTITLWEVATGRDLLTFKGHDIPVTSATFSPDGKTLATGSDDRTVKVWDVATGQELATLKGHGGSVLCLAFSPDGRRLATGGSEGTVKLWDVITRQELITIKGHAGVVNAVAFSPDGRWLASGSGDRTIRLWRAATDREVLAKSGK